MKELLILKDEEWMVLMAAAGVRTLYGFSKRGKREDENIPYIIHELVRRNVIRKEQGELRINEPYAEVVKGIKDAKAVLSLVHKTQIHFYLGNPIVKVSDSVNDVESVKLGTEEADTVREYLADVFKPERLQMYPEEFLVGTLETENAVCKAFVSLSGFDGECIGRNIGKWELYEGRYKVFVKETIGENVEYIEFREWNHERILRFLQNATGGKADDID